MAADLMALQGRFGVAGVVEVLPGKGGLGMVRVSGEEGSGEMYLHGGHVTSWKPAGAEEVLWVSEKSYWEAGKPIRGGVPICFPWFGKRADDAALPQHGFARTMEWTLEKAGPVTEGVEVVMTLKSDAETRKLWGNEFLLRSRVIFGRELWMELQIVNTGNGELVAEEAQHTYFAVGDVRQATVTGLAGAHYFDKEDGMKEKTQEGEITVVAATDRPYFNTTMALELKDPVKHRQVRVEKSGSRSTVVWNPWSTNAKAMADFGDDEWPGMICIETANVREEAVRVKAGGQHVMGTRVQVV